MKQPMSKQLALVQALIAGIHKHFSTASSLAFGGQTTTPAALITLLTAFVSAMNALIAARAQTKNCEVALDLQETALAGIIKALKAYVLATFTDAATLADFGLAPPKSRRPLTAAELALRAARSAATRKARGTMGKVQKAAIKGSVPAASPVPSAANGAGTVKAQ
jgi:hypothetical protein